MRYLLLLWALVLAIPAMANEQIPNKPLNIKWHNDAAGLVETTIDQQPAHCRHLDAKGLQLCMIDYVDKSKAIDAWGEIRLFRNDKIYGRIVRWYSACASNEIPAGFADINGDGKQDLIVAADLACGNGNIISTKIVAVFLATRGDYKFADMLEISGFGYESGFYQRGNTIYLEESNWLHSSNIHPERGHGTYLGTNWYRWNGKKFMHDETLPIITRRDTYGFERDFAAHWKTFYPCYLDGPYHLYVEHPWPWLLLGKTRSFSRKNLPLDYPGEIDQSFPHFTHEQNYESANADCTLKADQSVAVCP